MKLILSLLLFVGSWTAAGQGTVDFRNGGLMFATEADRNVYFQEVGGVLLTGTHYVASLWFLLGADRGGDILDAGTHAGPMFPFRQPTTRSPGTWLVPAGSSPTLTLNGVDRGQTATLQVRVWDSVKYPSFEAALTAGEIGMSAPFNYTVPFGGSAPTIYLMNDLRAFAYVPEPAPWALLVMAGGLWWWMAKRKVRPN